MRLFPKPLRFVTALVVLSWSFVLHVTPAAAALTDSQLTGATAIASERDADLLAVQRALENRLVAQKLADYGVVPQEAEARLAMMSDEDLHTLASATKGLPSGGDSLGLVVSLLIIVLLVILILKLLNKEVVVR